MANGASRASGRSMVAAAQDSAKDGSAIRVFGQQVVDSVDGFARGILDREDGAKKNQVDTALKRIERDMGMLDSSASNQVQISDVEGVVLTTAVGLAFLSPYAFSAKVVELLVPAISALCASIGFSAEYLGKVAVSRGKEIAAATLQAPSGKKYGYDSIPNV